MSAHLALLIHDDSALYTDFATRANEAGWRMVICSTGDHAVELCRAGAPSAILLKGSLPDGDGLAICGALRAIADTRQVPILFLGNGREEERTAAFQAGADEYFHPPYDLRELAAKLRGYETSSICSGPHGTLVQGPVILDRAAHAVSVSGACVTLTATEYRLLEAFLTHPQMVLSREELIASAWNRKGGVTSRTVDVCVLRLRRKLESYGAGESFIHSVRGFGYGLAVGS